MPNPLLFIMIILMETAQRLILHNIHMQIQQKHNNSLKTNLQTFKVSFFSFLYYFFCVLIIPSMELPELISLMAARNLC